MSLVTRYVTSYMGSTSLFDQPIDYDRSCTGCGYNLRGLKTSGRCPECGKSITGGEEVGSSDPTAPRVRRRKIIEICDLPPGTIRKFSIGFYLAAVTLMGVITLVFFNFKIGLSDELFAATITGLSCVWILAVWLMTTTLDIPYDQRLGEPWELKVRTWARWLQLGWLMQSMVAWFVALSPTGTVPGLVVAGYITAELAGVAGIALLCMLLANLANWVRDEFAERCFNFTFFTLIVVSPLQFIVLPLGMTVLSILFIVFVLLWPVWFVGLVAFPVGMWSLGRAMSWAARHSRDRVDRVADFTERLAPEPINPAPRLEDHDGSAIPIETTGEHHDIRHDASRSTGAHAPQGAMRRDRYDHERGDQRSKPGDAPQPDLF